jgi:hydroxysqualene synthase
MTTTVDGQGRLSARVLEDAYRHCLRLARSHYENFPVASWLLPRRIQRPIAVIYAFARSADDFADEGDLSAAARDAQLRDYAAKLDALRADHPINDPIFIALSDVAAKYALPLDLLHDLLIAFRQDVTKHRYADFAEVLDYCRHSANPVGRLVLHLYRAATAENLRDSDSICTALQLINFWQDLAQDCDENDRIYLPRDEMALYGVTEAQLIEHRCDAALLRLIDMQVSRARRLLLLGAPLGIRLKGRLGMEVRAIIQGGLCLLDALARRDNPFVRPRLRRRDRLRIVWRAFFP